MVSTEDLTALLNEEDKPKPSYLIDKGFPEDEIEPSKSETDLVSVEERTNEVIAETENKQYKCKYPNCDFSTDSLPELMTHSRQMHRGEEKPEVAKTRKKKEKDEGVSEREDKKILSEPLAYLKSVLKSFSAKNVNNIIEGLAGSENNLELLKELLISSDTNPKSHGYIVKRYADYLGQPSPDEPLKQSIKESSPNDPLVLLSKMRTDEITDTMYEKYKLANEERKVELDKKKKELKEPEKLKDMGTEFIEYNEPIYTETGQPVTDINGKTIYRKVKYNMNNLGMTGMLPFLTQNQQQKPSVEVELLKKEIEDTKKKLDSGGNSELSSLRQQMLEMHRKHEEENRLREIREESRRDRELLEKRIEEQNKKFEDTIKLLIETKKPDTMDTLAIKMAEMQKQYNDGLVKIQENFQSSLRERETQSIFSQLKDKLEYMEKRNDEQLRNIKDNTDGRVGSISETVKDFATDMTHTMELYMKDKEKEKTENELKKKIEDIQRTASMSKEQLLTSKGMEIAESAIKGGGEALKGFGSMLNKSTSTAADTMAGYDRVRQAMELKNQGFSPDQISKILSGNNGAPLPRVPSAQSAAHDEYTRLNKASDLLEQTKSGESIPKPRPVEITPETVVDVPLEKEIKFSTDSEK